MFSLTELYQIPTTTITAPLYAGSEAALCSVGFTLSKEHIGWQL